MGRAFKIGNVSVSRDGSLFVIAGPCVVENRELTLEVAHFLKNTAEQLDIPIIFKSYYEKASRTSLPSFRGLGLEERHEILS